jgi:argininosuccinate lyase
VVHHTHAGSIGNLCTQQVKAQMEAVLNGFPFSKVEEALRQLAE